MQDLAVIEKSLSGIAAAFKDGGLFFLIGVIAFLIYKVIILWVKKTKRSGSGNINIHIPGGEERRHEARRSGNGCPYHNEHEKRISNVETARAFLEKDMITIRNENRGDHEKIFNKLTDLAVSTERIESDIRASATAAKVAAEAAKTAASHAETAASAAAEFRRRRPGTSVA
jgi:hypothetical protein